MALAFCPSFGATQSAKPRTSRTVEELCANSSSIRDPDTRAPRAEHGETACGRRRSCARHVEEAVIVATKKRGKKDGGYLVPKEFGEALQKAIEAMRVTVPYRALEPGKDQEPLEVSLRGCVGLRVVLFNEGVLELTQRDGTLEIRAIGGWNQLVVYPKSANGASVRLTSGATGVEEKC